MIDVGLIGFGLAGRAFHAPVIRAVPGLRLAAILQRSGSEAAQEQQLGPHSHQHTPPRPGRRGNYRWSFRTVIGSKPAFLSS